MAPGGRLEHDLSSFLRDTANHARARRNPRQRGARIHGQPGALYHRPATASRGDHDRRGLASRLARGADPELQGAPNGGAGAAGARAADADHHGMPGGDRGRRRRSCGLRGGGHHRFARCAGQLADRDRKRRPRSVQPHSRPRDRRAVSGERRPRGGRRGRGGAQVFDPGPCLRRLRRSARRSVGWSAGAGGGRSQKGGRPRPEIWIRGGHARGRDLPRLGRGLPGEGAAGRGACGRSQDRGPARAA